MGKKLVPRQINNSRYMYFFGDTMVVKLKAYCVAGRKMC